MIIITVVWMILYDLEN